MTTSSSEERLLSQLRNLKLAGRSGDSVTPSRQLRWAVYQLLLAAAGIDPVTLEWNGKGHTPEDMRQRFVVPLTSLWDHLHTEIPGLPTLGYAKRTTGAALSNALGVMFGLPHSKVGVHNKKRYVVDTEALERQRELLSKIDGQPTVKKLRRLHATQKHR